MGDRVANLRVRVGSRFDKLDPGWVRVRVGYGICMPGTGYLWVIFRYFRVGELPENQTKKDPPSLNIFINQFFKMASDLLVKNFERYV